MNIGIIVMVVFFVFLFLVICATEISIRRSIRRNEEECRLQQQVLDDALEKGYFKKNIAIVRDKEKSGVEEFREGMIREGKGK